LILDGLLCFTSLAGGGSGAGDSPTTGTQVSTNSLDLGLVAGIPTSANGGGARDIGIGDDPAMKILVQVTTAFLGGTSLQVNIQGAPDNGAGAAGAFTIMASGPVVVLANLAVGTRLFDNDMPRPAPSQALPRFIQLGYVNVGTFTAGVIKGFLVLDRMDIVEQSNATMGGYPAGVTVAN
jgi:hypothetical protein